MSQETIDSTVHIPINGTESANVDSFPAVHTFLEIKERSNLKPNKELFKERDFLFINHF